ncbi:MAG: glutamine amidotransferase [Planctomycetaceae bacterium]
MRLVFDPIWPWPVVGAIVVALVALTVAFDRRRARPLPMRVRALLIGLRLTAIALLTLAMIRPALQESRTDDEPGVLYVLLDRSRSMTVRDGPGSSTRREWLLNVLGDIEPKWKELGESLDVRFFDFGEELVPVEKPEADAEATQTAIGAALEEIHRAAQRERIVGVLLIGDGAQRALPPRDADPRQAARRLAELQVPIYTVGVGSEHLADVLDVAIEELQVDPLVYEKKLVPVSVRVRALGAQNRKISVRLLVEDRKGKRPGESGEMKLPPATQSARPVVEIDIARSAAVLPVELSYVPEGSGEFKIAVEVVPIEGELKTENNRRETIISVQSGGLRIAYFDIIRAEQKWLKMLNATQNIQLEYFPVRGGTLGGASNIRPALFQPDAYDVYILGDVSANDIGAANLAQLARRVDEGAGLLMIGGYGNFGAGGFANTPIARLLPVELSGGAGGNEITGELQMVPTQAGLRHYVMRLGPDSENAELWNALAPLKGANRLRMKPDRLVEVLAESTTGVPLLFAHQVGNARVMAFAGDTTYRWYLAGQEAEHQRFWRQMALYLAGMEDDSENPVWVRVDPRNYAPGQRTTLRMGARDEDQRPLPDAEFDVVVTDPEGTEHRPAPRRSGDESHADFERTAIPGDYWVRVDGRSNGRPHGSAWTRFIIDARDLELDDPAADFALLDAIASSGRRMQPDELAAFLDRQAEEKTFDGRLTEIHRTNLWDNWPFLLLFAAVMTAEWAIRKRHGLA